MGRYLRICIMFLMYICFGAISVSHAGSITGEVTLSPAASLCGDWSLQVQAYGADNVQVASVYGTPTIYNGSAGIYSDCSAFSYILNDLPAGTYRLQYSMWGYGTEWYSNAITSQNSTPVSVTSSGVTSGINETLAAAGSISGRVTSSTGGVVNGSMVSAYDDSGQTEIVTSYSSASGNYMLPSLTAGSYLVRFTAPGYAEQWYAGSADAAGASPVTVAGGAITMGVDATLEPVGPAISGCLTSASGAGLQGAIVTLFNPETTWEVMTTYTDAAGNYTLTNISSGSYRVRFTAPGYSSIWYGGSNKASSAAAVTVGSGMVSGINAVYPAGGISGKVSLSPSASYCFQWLQEVTVYDADNVQVASVNGVPSWSGDTSSGNYSCSEYNFELNGLAAGTYRVQYRMQGYGTEWHGNTAELSGATPVSVATAGIVSGIDGALESEGYISGRVTGSSGEVNYAQIRVYDSSGQVELQSGFSYSSGDYAIGSLATGYYKVRFSAYGYGEQWYSAAVDAAGASLVSVTGGATTPAIDAVLVSTTGTISGRVTNSPGAGISGVWVTAYNSNYSFIGGTMTQPDGSYTISGVQPGSCKLVFNGADTGYITQWHNNKASFAEADILTVTAGVTTSGINAVLAQGGMVSGRVTNSSGAGIGGLYVYVFHDDYQYASGAMTDSDGFYTIYGLRTGSYKLQFEGYGSEYVTQWYNNKGSFADSDMLTVTAGVTTNGINAVLVKTGAVSGRVTNSAGEGVSNIWVAVYDTTHNQITSIMTQPDGSYTITRLPPGSYKFHFRDSNPVYLEQWYNNKASYETANAVAVTAGATTSGINAVLVQGGIIAGRVTNSSGAGIEGVWVDLYDSDNSYNNYSGALTQSDGRYAITGLEAGNYKLVFNGNGSGYLTQWYSNKTYFDVANVVTVTAEATTSGVNAVLALGGTITGRVTNGSGSAIPDIWVTAYDTNYNEIAGATVDENGSYTVTGLPTGSYKLTFHGTGGYLTQWYDNKTSYETADPVAVTAGTTTSVINAVLALGGTITGRVTNGSGEGVAGIQIYVYDANYRQVSWTVTQPDGGYAVLGLPTGSYKLLFNNWSTQYVTQWYGNKSSFHEADAVTVTNAATTSGVNMVMMPGGSISGKVSNSSGCGIAGVYVTIYDKNNNYITQVPTSEIGEYIVSGLSTGKYKVLFDGSWSVGYVSRYYNNAAGPDGAILVSVNAPDTTCEIDATLTQGGSISGKVTNAVGTGLEYIYIYVFDQQGNEISSTLSGWDGSYTVRGIPDGNFKVQFINLFQYGNGLAGQWYSGKGRFGVADQVTVAGVADTTGIDVVLGTGPNVIIYPVVMNFGTTVVGGKAYKNQMVYNDGGENLVLGNIAISGSNAPEFALLNDHCSGRTLPPRWSCEFQTVFTPTSVGAKSAQINIPSNDPDTAILDIPVKGTASPALVTLNVAVTGGGNGSVTVTPPGTAGNVGFSETYETGTLVGLHAEPAPYNVFSGWTGACAGTADCSLAMDTNKSVTATFAQDTAQKVRLEGATQAYYPTILGAYQAAGSGDSILMWATGFTENFSFGLNKDVTLKGGYNSGYTGNSGYSTLFGPVTIGKGALTVERVVIR